MQVCWHQMYAAACATPFVTCCKHPCGHSTSLAVRSLCGMRSRHLRCSHAPNHVLSCYV